MSRADVLSRVRLLSQAQRRTLAERLVRDSGNARRMVATWSGSASPATLQAHIDDTLAPYMRPHRLCKVDALPRTPNGKVDYAALEALCAQSRPAEGADRTRSTAAEWSWLADIWRQVLGMADVSAHDSFFDLGGDSILGLRVVARARRAGYPLTVSDIFEFPKKIIHIRRIKKFSIHFYFLTSRV